MVASKRKFMDSSHKSLKKRATSPQAEQLTEKKRSPAKSANSVPTELWHGTHKASASSGISTATRSKDPTGTGSEALVYRLTKEVIETVPPLLKQHLWRQGKLWYRALPVNPLLDGHVVTHPCLG